MKGGFSPLLFALALAPRLYAALAWAREPVWDGHYYHLAARGIARGLGFTIDPPIAWSHYPVGYSALLAAVYRLFGDGQYVGPLLNALLGALLAVCVYRLARAATSERRARFAGLLVAAHPGLIAYTPLLMTEPLTALLFVVAAELAVRAHRRRRRAGSALGGALFGLATLVRPQSVLLAPALGLFARAGSGWLRRAATAAALASLVALAVVAPWTARNCLTLDGCAFVSTNGGWNLAIGSTPRATGRFLTLRGDEGCRVARGYVGHDRCWQRVALGWIRAEPARWLALVDDKLSHTFDHESFAIGYLAEADPLAWPPDRREQARELLTAVHLALLALAPLGMIAATRKRLGLKLAALALWAALLYRGLADAAHPFWPLALAIPAFALVRLGPRDGGVRAYAACAVATLAFTHAVFFGEDRYHLVVSPLVCLLCACALARRAPARRIA